MSKSNIIKSTRKIKCIGDSIDTNDFFLHPLTLQLYKNTDKTGKKICPTELYYDNTRKPRYVSFADDKISEKDIQTFMALPYLNLSIDHFLKIYKIDKIDSIIRWVDSMIEEDKLFDTINRIINVWIRFNFDDLINNNKILINIYKKIGYKYYPKVNIDNFENKINEWFKKNNSDNFYLDLGEYLFNN